MTINHTTGEFVGGKELTKTFSCSPLSLLRGNLLPQVPQPPQDDELSDVCIAREIPSSTLPMPRPFSHVLPCLFCSLRWVVSRPTRGNVSPSPTFCATRPGPKDTLRPLAHTVATMVDT